MTSKKRPEVETGEEGGEPKRPRGDGEEEKQPEAAQPSRRQGGRNWLSFSGRRQPRVGAEFQATALPSPSDPSEETKEETPESKEQPKE